MQMGFILVAINLLFILLEYFTRSDEVDVRFTDLYTILLGDIVGLSLINYAFGSTFDPADVNPLLLLITIVVAVSVTYVLHRFFKYNSREKSDSGYIKGVITLNGKIHLVYCFFQAFIVSLFILALNLFNIFFILGVGVYLLSVTLDIQKGTIFRST